MNPKSVADIFVLVFQLVDFCLIGIASLNTSNQYIFRCFLWVNQLQCGYIVAVNLQNLASQRISGGIG